MSDAVSRFQPTAHVGATPGSRQIGDQIRQHALNVASKAPTKSEDLPHAEILDNVNREKSSVVMGDVFANVGHTDFEHLKDLRP